MRMLRRLLKEESGATAIEYGLVAALISVAVMTMLGTLGQQLADRLDAAAVEQEAEPQELR